MCDNLQPHNTHNQMKFISPLTMDVVTNSKQKRHERNSSYISLIQLGTVGESQGLNIFIPDFSSNFFMDHVTDYPFYSRTGVSEWHGTDSIVETLVGNVR